MILITGANGHLGKATIDALLEKGVQPGKIAGLVRNEEKGTELKEKGVIVRIGDYNDYNSLTKAFTGVDKLLLVSGTDAMNRSKQHEDAVKAAKETGVKHIVYSSFERKNETETSPIRLVAQSHLHTEKVIKESGIPYTILRNNLYADYIPLFAGNNASETGIVFPAGETKGAFVLRKDMAEAAANVLTSEGHQNKEYYISHTETISFREAAAIISEASGKQVVYHPDASLYIDSLIKAGFPKEVAHVFAGFGEAISQGEFIPGKSDLEKLLGRKPTSVKDYLTEVYGKVEA